VARLTKAQLAEQEDAREKLRELLPPGSTVYTVLRHVSRSGMMRAIDAYVIQDSDPRWISRLAARATGDKFSEKYDAVEMGGCGMDMGFALVYGLSRTLYPQGFGCIGERCPSNDHSNRDRDYTPHLTLLRSREMVDGLSYNVLHDARGLTTGRVERDHWHADGGYALKHRWM
jgi:hypothetical protein